MILWQATPLKARPPPGSGGGTGRWRVRAYEGPEDGAEGRVAPSKVEGLQEGNAKCSLFRTGHHRRYIN